MSFHHTYSLVKPYIKGFYCNYVNNLLCSKVLTNLLYSKVLTKLLYSKVLTYKLLYCKVLKPTLLFDEINSVSATTY